MQGISWMGLSADRSFLSCSLTPSPTLFFFVTPNPQSPLLHRHFYPKQRLLSLHPWRHVWEGVAAKISSGLLPLGADTSLQRLVWATGWGWGVKLGHAAHYCGFTRWQSVGDKWIRPSRTFSFVITGIGGTCCEFVQRLLGGGGEDWRTPQRCPYG